MAEKKTETAQAEVLTVVHENDKDILKTKDVIPEGVVILDDETYNKVARVGGFFDPTAEPQLHRPPLPLRSLRDGTTAQKEIYAAVLKVIREGGKG